MPIFSLAQSIGYVAFALGVTAFLQKKDRRLKSFNALQSIAYAVHFLLLNNAPASACSMLSACRSLLAHKSRSPWLAALMVGLNLAFGFYLVHTPLGWLPVFASCLGAVAFFVMTGITMRVALFICTLGWLTNNIVSGSIGGTALESVIAVVNLWTISRLFAARAAREAAREPDAVLEEN